VAVVAAPALYAVTRELPRSARAQWGLSEWGRRLYNHLPKPLHTDNLRDAGICHYMVVYVSGDMLHQFDFVPLPQDGDDFKPPPKKPFGARKEKATFLGEVREERLACLPISAVKVGRTALSLVGRWSDITLLNTRDLCFLILVIRHFRILLFGKTTNHPSGLQFPAVLTSRRQATAVDTTAAAIS